MPETARELEKQPNLTAWLSKEEAADALRTSIKTIERMTARGQLRCAQRPAPGRKPQPVYDPEQIAGLMRQRELLPLALGDGITPTALVPAASAFASAPSQLPRFLGLEQAAAYCGLSAPLLRRLIREKQLQALRDGRQWKLRREDLDKL